MLGLQQRYGGVRQVYDWNWLKKRAEFHPHKIAIIDGETEEKWSYLSLYEESLRWAHALKSFGIVKGDRVSLLAPNRVEYLLLLFACRELGATFVPFNWRLTPYEITGLLQDCKPGILFYDERFSNTVEKLAFPNVKSLTEMNEHVWKQKHNKLSSYRDLVQMDEPWMMIYTGGTTGKPKGAVLSYRSVMTNSINTIITWSLTESEKTITIMPMFHTGGLNALTIPILHAGGTVILCREFEPNHILQKLITHECTIVLMVPTMYQAIIETETFKRETFPHMHVFLSGGAPCPVNIYEAFQEKNLPFKEGYGLTEAGPNNFYIDPTTAIKKKGSVGKPMLFNDVKLLGEDGKEVPQGEIGEMVIYGSHLFHHYWERDEETAEVLHNGGLRTGDLAYVDEDGDFYILGRKKEMLISGGENIYPLEIENMIAAHPVVKEVAVVGLPDKKWGERVVAAISPRVKENDDQLEIRIKEFCQKKLANYKIPKEIYVFDELPKTHVGKINKQLIVEKIQKMNHIYKID